jgi:hypothetical protein
LNGRQQGQLEAAVSASHAGADRLVVPVVRHGAVRGTAYEEFIGATGCVPTRDNLHDFFNGLVWQSFPLVKRQLSALQAAQIAVAGVGKIRGPARDLNAGRALVDDLRAHR